jgi:hypothetical protein
MKYSYQAKNTITDKIYATRLQLIDRLNIDINKNPNMYAYYMNAYLGRLIC